MGEPLHRMAGGAQSRIPLYTTEGGWLHIDTAALVDALRAKRIGGAGIDVHEVEPPPPDYPLYGLDNVVVSDHAAWYSEDSIRQIQREAAECVVAVLAGKRPENLINPAVYDVLDSRAK